MWDSGSLARLHRTTQGWFLSRRDELLDRLAVDALGPRADRLLGVRRLRPPEEQAAPDAEVEPDRRRLVDDDDAQPVGMLEDLLGVRVVRGPEGVGAHPRQQREVVHHGGVVVAAAMDVEVLVLAEAPEVERLAVDEESRPSTRTVRMPTGRV